MIKVVKVIFALTFVVYSFADVDEELKALETKFYTSLPMCANKTGATEEQIMATLSKQIPEERAPQCFLACLAKSFNVMNASNKFNKSEIDKIFEPLVKKITMNGGEKEINKIVELVNKCVEEQPDEKDECLAAKKAFQCVIINEKKIH